MPGEVLVMPSSEVRVDAAGKNAIDLYLIVSFLLSLGEMIEGEAGNE